MSTFSLTAPRVTEEFECREREALTPAEVAEIERDMNGTCEKSSIRETDDMMAQATVQMEEAIELIPQAQKVDYLRAKELCPELFFSEVDPIRFLRCDSYNPWAAAERMVKFWAFRRKVFGDNAFLPLALTGHGALSPQAIEMVGRGYWAGLPADSKGRTVVYMDRSRNVNSPEFRNGMLQVMMYLFMTLLEERESNDFVILVNGSAAVIATFDRKLARDGTALLRDCLPITTRAIHVCLPARQPPFHFVVPVCKFILGKRLRQRFIVHHGSDLEVVLGYESYGIGRAHAPPAIGGNWDIEGNLAEWVAERRAIESRREEAIAQN